MPGVLIAQEEEQSAPSPMEVTVKESAVKESTVKESTEEVPEEKKKPENDAPASRAVVGIIYPPPEVRSIPCDVATSVTSSISGSMICWVTRAMFLIKAQQSSFRVAYGCIVVAYVVWLGS